MSRALLLNVNVCRRSSDQIRTEWPEIAPCSMHRRNGPNVSSMNDRSDLFSLQVPALLLVLARQNALIYVSKRMKQDLLKEELFLSTSLSTPSIEWIISCQCLITMISVVFNEYICSSSQRTVLSLPWRIAARLDSTDQIVQATSNDRVWIID